MESSSQKKNKTVVLLSVYLLQAQLEDLGNFLLQKLLPYPHIELVMIIVIVPSVLNTLCFWVTDNLIKGDS